jgi:hypothetical protein
MNNENNTPFYRAPWLLGVLVIIAVFVLCFVAIDYVSKPDTPKEEEIEEVVIATQQSNGELIALAKKQGWIAPDATEMTSIDAAKVKLLGEAFQNSNLKHFDEFRYFLGVEEILSETFAGSEALASITIPKNVISINYGAFANCPNLMEMRVDTANTHYDSRKDCNGIICTWKGKLMLVAGCRTTTIVDNVHYIAPQAFRGIRGMKAVALPEKMDEIGEEAFRDCADLEAFIVPQGVRFIEQGTFQGCTQLKIITLSKSVERMKKDAFKGCTSLSSIMCMKKYPPIIEDAFDEYKATVYVPMGMQNSYYSNRYWKNFPTVTEIRN